MTGADRVPTTTAEVTAAWLTAALRTSGTIGPNTSVASISADPTAAGIGFMGEVGKLAVTYTGDEHEAAAAPTRMIVKFPTASPAIKAMMRPTRVYEREHRFYAELAGETPVGTPAVYHVTCRTSDDPDVDEDYVLVLEDVGDLELGDQLAGLSPEQAAAALRGLARHHARFWHGAGLERADFIPVIDGPLNLAGRGIYEASLPGFTEVFADALWPEMVPVAQAYGRNHPLLLGRFAAMPHTLVHFDYRADNLFFDRRSGDVTVIDWQSISRGGGAADVGYLLGQNLAAPVLREHEDELLHVYHDELLANGVTGYEFDQLVADYRVGIVYGWVIPVFAVGSLDSSSERAMALWNEVIGRVQDAIFRHGAQELIS